mmetsp:Transcript_24288/g.74891  ORF Transcript_24288/g.74891 Transcript_24288/m.74891 type:complete len:211 (+) Transcript_24288:505-1137(+)
MYQKFLRKLNKKVRIQNPIAVKDTDHYHLICDFLEMKLLCLSEQTNMLNFVTFTSPSKQSFEVGQLSRLVDRFRNREKEVKLLLCIFKLGNHHLTVNGSIQSSKICLVISSRLTIRQHGTMIVAQHGFLMSQLNNVFCVRGIQVYCSLAECHHELNDRGSSSRNSTQGTCRLKIKHRIGTLVALHRLKHQVQFFNCRSFIAILCHSDKHT